MKLKEPVVSVLMTSFNREKFIADSIESILNSTFSAFELIVVDDFSNDSTVAVAESYERLDSRVRIYKNAQNLGDYPNRNKAASYARGKYIKYLDSDDIIYPHGLEVMVRSMEQFPGSGFGLCSVSDPERPYPVCLTPQEAYWEHFNGYGFFNRAPGNSIIRRSAFNAVGGFSGKRMIGDNELWLKLGRQFDLVKFPRDLVWDRTHSGQERQSEYAQRYGKLRRDVFREAFEHPDCPLSEDQKAKIRALLKKKSVKDKLVRPIKSVLRRF